MMKSSITRRVFISVAAVVLGVPAAALAADPVSLRLGHVGFPNSLFDISANEFAKRANQELKGKVDVKVFHSSQLGSDEQMLKGVRVASPEMFLPSTVMSTVEPRFGVFEMPYLITSREHMKKVADTKAVQDALFKGLPGKGMRVLAVWENGFRHITNNSRPIAKPDDLKGIKLRVPSGVWRVRMFQAYGANPTPMAFGELYSALQAGVMDGQENPLAQIWSGRLHEVQKHLSLSGHVYTPAYLIIGEDTWKKLPADVQKGLTRIASQMGEFARSEGARLDKELIGQMKALQINEVDKEAFIKASEKVYQQFATEVPGGAQLVKTIQGLR
ncbi:MAG TPA: TRAP transporter substrate-binding protein [Myxococcaceae bacterium]|nr:TRAP transporter substrate-binding protein [Myxococcaceae bacterium]